MDIPLVLNEIGIFNGFNGYKRKASSFGSRLALSVFVCYV